MAKVTKKPTSISAKALSSAVTAAVKKLNVEALDTRVISRPEIIGIRLKDVATISDALKAAESVSRSVGVAAKANTALKGLRTPEAAVVITKKGILAGFFPVLGSPIAF